MKISRLKMAVIDKLYFWAVARDERRLFYSLNTYTTYINGSMANFLFMRIRHLGLHIYFNKYNYHDSSRARLIEEIGRI